MNKKDVLKLFNNVSRKLDRKSPEILASIGIAGMLTTVVLAVKATPKALTLIDEASNVKNAELTKGEVIKVAWKPYLPAVITGIMSTTCMIGSVHIGARRIAALSTAYKLTETAFSEYKEKVVETIGEKKEKAIKEKIVQDKLEKNPVSNASVIVTGKGKTLCLDAAFNQYFDSDYEAIRKAVNDVNYQMLGCNYISLNDFYDALGIDRIPVGDEVGWNITKEGKVEIEFSSQIASDGRPCLVIQYLVAPKYDYWKSY